MLFMFCRVLVA